MRARSRNLRHIKLFFFILGQVGGYYSPYTGGFTAAQMAAAAAAAAAQQTTQVIFQSHYLQMFDKF